MKLINVRIAEMLKIIEIRIRIHKKKSSLTPVAYPLPLQKNKKFSL